MYAAVSQPGDGGFPFPLTSPLSFNTIKTIYMKTIVRNFAVVAMLALMLTSCSTERRALSQMRSLTNRIEMRGDNYSTQDWENAYEDYKAIDAKMDAKKLTPEQQQEYGELKARCLKSFAKSKVESITSSLRSLINQGMGFLKGILEGF